MMALRLCPYSGECFGKNKERRCTVLNDLDFNGNTCPFQKKTACQTNGKSYPYDYYYEEVFRRARNDSEA